MGIVPKPIPLDVLAKMPPHTRAEAVAQQRAQLVRAYRSQGQTAGYGIGLVIALLVYAAYVFWIAVR